MLEGLEISEIRLSELERTKRMDTEFYSRDNIQALDELSAKGAKPITEFVSVSDGNHMTISDGYCDEGGVPYYRGTDIYNFFIEQASNPLRIEQRAFDEPNMRRSHLKKGDVLMSIVGAIIGNLSLVTTDTKATCSCKLAIMRPQNIEPSFLAVYLKSFYGQNQIQKFKRGAAQTGLILEDFDQILIPEFSDDFRQHIATIVTRTHHALEQAEATYKQAETMHLDALGLDGWQPPTPLTYARSATDVFCVGRLDAEHFQPKYDDMLSRIAATGIEMRRLDQIIMPIKNGFDCRDFVENGTSYIRVGDIKNGRINLDSALKVPVTASTVGKDIELQIGDVLFTRKGSFGNAAPVWQEAVDAVISSEIMLLRRRKEYLDVILPEYLALFFNSIAGNQQAEKWAHGMAFFSITQDDMGCFLIPLLPLSEQEKLRELLEQSETARKKAQNLLDVATRAVEIAIEQDEQAALAFVAEGGGNQ